MSDFLDAIVSGEQLRTTLHDGLRAVRLVEAIERSYVTDRSVAIAPRTDDQPDG
jgi:predicted dehydrogenase